MQSFIPGTVLLTHRPGLMSLLLHPFLHYSTLNTICCARVQPTRRSKLPPADCRVMLLCSSSYHLLHPPPPPPPPPPAPLPQGALDFRVDVWGIKSVQYIRSSLSILHDLAIHPELFQMEATICIIIAILL